MRLFALSSLVLLIVVVLTMLLHTPVDGTVRTRERRARDPGVTDEQAAVFEVLDDLFPYEVGQRPFVEVEIGYTRRLDDARRFGPFPNHYRFGFLLADEGKKLRVQFLDGERAQLNVSSSGTPTWCRTGYALADLREHALALATHARRLGPFYGPEYGEPITPLTRTLLAARALARLGRADDCAAVWHALPQEWHTLEGLLSEPECHGLMSRPFVEDLANRVALDFDDLSLSWSDLLERHDRFLAHVAVDCHSAKDLRERRDAIAGVLNASGWSLWKSSSQRTIEELRNTARPASGGSWAGTWLVDRWEPDPAAQASFDRIVAAGLDRVPDLIAALEDRTPTRSVYFYAGHGGAFINVQDVHEVATGALRVIYGGHDVIRTGSSISTMEVDDWRDWYARVKQTGLRPFLAGKMREEADAADAANSYLTLWPGDGAAVLDAMAGANDETWSVLLDALERSAAAVSSVRERLVALLHATVDGPSWRRSFAARTLLRLGDTYGARALHEARQHGETLTDPEWLVLLESGLPDPWQEIERRLDDPIDRAGLLHAAHVSSREEILERADGAARTTIDGALRRCLLRLLTETETWAHSSCTDAGMNVVHDRRRVSMHRPSVADLAAYALATGWPKEFVFDPRGTGLDRRRQIVRLLRQVGIAPSSAEPSEEPDSENVVGTIFFEGDPLPEDARALVSALTGKTFDVAAIAETMGRVCRDNGKVIALHCERRRGSRLVVRCATRPVTDEDRGADAVGIAFTCDGYTNRMSWTEGAQGPDEPEFSLIFRR